jgi:carboxymethylenebutenolidase
MERRRTLLTGAGAKSVFRGLALMALLAAAACGSDGGAPAPAASGASVDTAAVARDEDLSVVEVGASEEPRLPVIEQELAYGESADRNLIGYLAMPADAVEPQPGVLIVHDNAGLDDPVRALVRRLAGEGFVVLAVDLFDGETAPTPERARALAKAVTAAPKAALANLEQGYEYLSRYALAPKVGVLGMSFGGTWALQAGVDMAGKLDAVVTYYGQVLRNDDLIDALDEPLLGLFGADDRSIPVADVQSFRIALKQREKDAEILIYSNVGHGFADRGSPNYDPQTAQEAWTLTVEFLNRALR